MLEIYDVDEEHRILVDTETKVCYLECGKFPRHMYGGNAHGITVMLNANGTPKLWEE